MNKFAATVFATLLLAVAGPAYAEDEVATLRVDRGTVMVSSGGDFVSANSGTVVVTGQRLMVTENSAATVVYDNGCDQEYTAPGVYVIEPECRRAVAILPFDWHSFGILAGTFAAGVAILWVDGKAPPRPQPISR